MDDAEPQAESCESGEDNENQSGIRVEGLDREQLSALADRVYALLCHELMIERERHARRSLV